MAYEKEITVHRTQMVCGRCASSMTKEDVGIYYDTGLCSWCEHMTSKLEVDESVSSQWNPEKDLEATDSSIISPEEFRTNPGVLVADPRLLEYLDAHPDEVLGLDPWKFQEFVAELLQRFGYKVRIGPPGRDGGVDVFAEQDPDTGPELVLVQCKRNAPESKVSQPVVKQLFADVCTRNASRGLVVTTSTFTRPALEYIRQFRYRLAGADIDK
jgi:restriction system protein